MSIMERAITDYDADIVDKYWKGVDVCRVEILGLMRKGYTPDEIEVIIASRD